MSTNWDDVLAGLNVAGLGLLGVFSVLIVFYFIVVLLDRIRVRDNDAFGNGESHSLPTEDQTPPV